MNHHPFTQQKEDERNQTLLNVFGASVFTSAPTPYEDFLEKKYPDIPAPYRQIWARSDEELAQGQERRDLIERTITAHERAIQVSKSMLLQDTETTPAKIRATKNTLKAAIHRAEELLTEVSLSYPIVQDRSPSLTAEESDSIGPIPKLIFSNKNAFMIWLPYLPSRRRAATSLLFQETQDLLFSTDVPRLKNWHCDFVHCYHPKHIVGVYDVDNHDYKAIIDLIAKAMFSKDSYDHFSCGMYNLATADIEPGCYMRVVKRETKDSFLKDFISQATTSSTELEGAF